MALQRPEAARTVNQSSRPTTQQSTTSMVLRWSSRTRLAVRGGAAPAAGLGWGLGADRTLAPAPPVVNLSQWAVRVVAPTHLVGGGGGVEHRVADGVRQRALQLGLEGARRRALLLEPAREVRLRRFRANQTIDSSVLHRSKPF